MSDLERCLCLLIRHGHGRAWDYGWSFFLAAVEELGEAYKKRK